jgi:hypothetical protein
LPKISPINPQKLIKILEKSGFKFIRQKGSHAIMINDKRNQNSRTRSPRQRSETRIGQSNNKGSGDKQRKIL